MPQITTISADTRAIADLLNAASYGEEVTIDAMSNAIGRDIRPVRYIALAALRVAERETGAVFATIRCVGYRRLTSDEFYQIGSTARARIRKVSKRSNRAMSAAMEGTNDMDPAARMAVLREQSMLGLLAHLSQDRHAPKLAPDADRPQPLAITMRGALAAMGVHVKTPPAEPQ